MVRWRNEGRRHNVPSPLEGEGQGGGWQQIQTSTNTPLPTPPPQGGREQTEFAVTQLPKANAHGGYIEQVPA
jgi:hypothetical protein